jgi:hypothetical protein
MHTRPEIGIFGSFGSFHSGGDFLVMKIIREITENNVFFLNLIKLFMKFGS